VDSTDAELTKALDRVVAEMRDWSEDQPDWTWTDGVADNYVGGLAYSFCLLLEEKSVQQVEELLIDQSDDDALLEEEWLYLLELSHDEVCPDSA
jgi:hypothetical protein